MIAMLVFSVVCALLVLSAGRGDAARDPRFTGFLLVALALFPLSLLLPKVALVPVVDGVGAASGFPWRGWVIGVWATGVAVRAVRLGMAVRVIAGWREGSRRVGWETGVEVRSLAGLAGPVAFGVLRPVIFVPTGWSLWSEETRRMILEHELAHHRRRDPLWRWIAEIACAIHGGNPLVVWISRRLAMQCEYACDALVLRNGIRPAAYARLLCDFAQDRSPAGPVLAMAVRSSLESRVRRLMAPQGKRGSASLLMLIVLGVLAGGGLALIGLSAGADDGLLKQDAELRWSADPFPGN